MFLFLAAFTSLFTLPAFSDVFDHQKQCETPEVLEKIGPSGSCHNVIGVRTLERKGSCTGILFGRVVCSAHYASSKDDASVSITCSEFNKVIFSQELEAEIVGYSVVRILEDSFGDYSTEVDPLSYTSIANQVLEISIARDPKNFTRTKTKFKLRLGPQVIELGNPFCF